MRTRIQKWGNSLALRIPKALALETHLQADSPVELSLVDGNLVVVPITKPAFTLESLVAGITKKNRHPEVQTGPPQGNEAW